MKRSEVVPVERLHAQSKLYDHRIEHQQDTLRDSLHKVDRDDVVQQLSSDNTTVQYALERVNEIVEGGIFLEREAYVKQLLNRVSDVEDELHEKDQEMVQLRFEWDEFRKQVALKTDLEAQRDTVQREELERLQELSETSEERNKELESEVRELKLLLDTEKSAHKMEFDGVLRKNTNLQQRVKELETQVQERDLFVVTKTNDGNAKESALAAALALGRKKVEQLETSLAQLVNEKDELLSKKDELLVQKESEQTVKNAKIRQQVELGEELTVQVEEQQQENPSNTELMDIQMKLEQEKESNIRLSKELNDALSQLDVTTTQLAMIPKEYHGGSHLVASPTTSNDAIHTVHQLETELRYCKNQANDIERALIHERTINNELNTQLKHKEMLLNTLEVKYRVLEDEKTNLVTLNQQQENNNERRVVILESEVGRIRGLASSEHENLEQRISMLVKDMEHWKNQCERAVREAERIDVARAEAVSKYTLLGSRVEELVHAHGKDIEEQDAQHNAEKEELMNELHQMQEQLHTLREKANQGKQEARDRVDLAQRKVTQLQNDLKQCTMELDKVMEENSKLLKTHNNCDTVKSSLEKSVQNAEMEVADLKRDQRILNIKIKEQSNSLDEKDADMDLIKRSLDRACEARVVEEVSKVKMACTSEIREMHDKNNTQLNNMQKVKRDLENELEQVRTEQERQLRSRDQEWRGRLRDLEQSVRDTEAVRVEAMVAEAKREIVEKSLLPEVVQSREARLRTEYEGELSKMKREGEELEMQRKSGIMRAQDDQKAHFVKTLEESKRMHAEEGDKLKRRAIDLKNMLDSMEKDKSSEIEALKKSVTLKDSEIRRIQGKLEEESARLQKELETQRDKAKSMTNEFDSKVHAFEDNSRKLQNLLETEKSAAKRHEDIIKQLQGSMLERKTAFDALSTEKQELEKKLAVLTGEKGSVSETLKEQEAENIELKDVLRSINQELLELRQEVSTKSKDMGILQQQEEKLGNALLGLQGKYDEAVSRSAEHQSIRDELQSEIEMLQNKLAAMQGELETVYTSNKELVTSSNTLEEENRQHRMHAHESELDLIARLDSMEAQLSEEKARVHSKGIECSTLCSDMEKLRSYTADLEMHLTQYKAKLEQHDEMVGTLTIAQHKISTLEEAISKYDDVTIDKTNLALSNAKNEVELLKAVEKRNLSQISDLHGEIKDHQSTILTLEDSVYKGNEKSNQLAIELDDEKAKYGMLLDEFQCLEGEMSKLRALLKELEAENEQLVHTIHNMKSQEKLELEDAMQVCEDTLGKAEKKKTEYEAHVSQQEHVLAEYKEHLDTRDKQQNAAIREKEDLTGEIESLKKTQSNSEKLHFMLQSSISDLEADKQQQSKAVMKVKSMLEEQEQECDVKISKLKAKIASLEDIVDVHVRSIHGLESSLTVKTLELESCKVEVDTVQRKNSVHASTIEDLEQEKTKLRIQVAEYSEKVANMENTVRSMKMDLSATISQKDRSNEDLNACNTLCVMLEGNVNKLDRENKNLQDKFEQARVQIQEYTTQVHALKADIAHKKEALLEREKEATDAKDKSVQVQTELGHVQSELHAVNREKSQLLHTVEDLRENITHLEQMCSKLQQQILELHVEKDAVISSLEAQVPVLTKQLADVTEDKRKSELVLVSSQEKEKSLYAEVRMKEEDVRRGKEHISQLEDTVADLRVAKKSAEASAQDLQSTVESLQVRLSTKEGDIDTAKKDFFALSDEVHKLRSMEKLYENLKRDLDEKVLLVDQLQEVLRGKEHVLETKTLQIVAMERDITTLRNTLDNSKTQTSTLEAVIQEYKGMKHDSDAVIVQLESQNAQLRDNSRKLQQDMQTVSSEHSKEMEYHVNTWNMEKTRLIDQYTAEITNLKAEIANLTEKHTLEVLSLNTKYMNEVESTHRTHTQQLEDIHKKNEQDKTSSQNHAELQQNTLKLDHQSLISKMQCAHQAELQDAKTATQTAVAQAKSEAQEAVTQAKKEAQSLIAQSKVDTQATIAQAKEDCSAQARVFEKNLAVAKDDHAVQVAHLEKKIEHNKERLDALYTDLNKAHIFAKEMEMKAQHFELGVSEKKVVIEQQQFQKDQVSQEKRVLEAKFEGLQITNQKLDAQLSVLEARAEKAESLVHTQILLEKANREIIQLTQTQSVVQQEQEHHHAQQILLEGQNKQRMDEKTKYIAELEHKTDTLEQQCVVYNVDATRLHVTCTAQESTIVELREKLEKYKGRGEKLLGEVQAHLQRDIIRWEEKYNKSQKYIVDQESNISSMHVEIESLQAKCATLSAESAEKRELQRQLDEQDDKLLKKAQLEQRKDAELTEARMSLQSISLLNQRISDLADTVQQQHAEQQNAHVLKTKLQRKVEEYRTRLHAIEQHNTYTGESLHSIAAEIDLLRRASMPRQE